VDNATGGGNLQKYMRTGLIEMVLATDQAKHMANVDKLKKFVEEGDPEAATSQADKQKALERKLFLLSTLLHAADISNPARPKHIMLSWSQRILEEFWAQGDEERGLGLEISPLCDRASGRASVAKGQIGFIRFVVQPLYEPLAMLVTCASEALGQLEENKLFWEDQDAKNASYEEIFGTAPISDTSYSSELAEGAYASEDSRQ